MIWKQILRNCLIQLDKPLIRYTLVPVLTPMAMIKYRSPFHLVYPLKGQWCHRQLGGCTVDRSIHFKSLKQYESETQDHWGVIYTPQPGDTVLDVGAGIGSETYFYSRAVGPSGRVLAIEAHPETCHCLRRLCQENKLNNVTVVNMAVGDQEGEVLIDDRQTHISNSILGVSKGIPVPMKTLDAILEQCGIERVDFLKMNIEGAERMAMQGMMSSLKIINKMCISCHDFIADEGGNSEFRTRAFVQEFLQGNGFAVSSRDTDPRGWVRYQVMAVAITAGVDS